MEIFCLINKLISSSFSMKNLQKDHFSLPGLFRRKSEKQIENRTPKFYVDLEFLCEIF